MRKKPAFAIHPPAYCVVAMLVELSPQELSVILEGLDYVKSRVAFKKAGSYEEKTARLRELDELEQRLRAAETAS